MPHVQTPKKEQLPDPAAAEEHGPDIGPFGPLRMLVADDNVLNGLLMEEQLHLLGLAAEIAGSGQQALERWREGGFAALLTDIQMPGMDGYELARSIRDEERDGARIPIIALTANALHEGSARWKAAGIDDYLIKPVELAKLKLTLERHLRKRADGEPLRAASAPAAGSGEPVDPRTLALMVGSEPAVLQNFLNAFAASANVAAANLDAAVATGDRARAGSLAHQLRAGAGAVGAHRLAQLCASIEGAARQADDSAAGSIDASWQLLRSEIGVVERWILEHGSAASQAAGRPPPSVA